MQIINRDRKNLVSTLDPEIGPVARVEEGEIFVVETAHHLYLWKEKLAPADADLIETVPGDIANPMTGPIAVEGTEPGDVIVLKILDIVCEEEGDATTTSGSGLLRSRLKKPTITIIKNQGTMFEIGDGLFVWIRPVIGCIATTPIEPILTLMPGPHGGNIDDPNVAIGAKVHLPVYVPGANFAVGDVHAAQADGEGICGVDINARVTLRLEKVCKGMNIPELRIETDDKWVIDKEGENMEEALEKACLAMTDFLMGRLDLPEEGIGILLSSVGGFHISQAGFYGYPVVLRAEVPKWVDRKGRL
jgi:amidase